jgi:hypothetical protein
MTNTFANKNDECHSHSSLTRPNSHESHEHSLLTRPNTAECKSLGGGDEDWKAGDKLVLTTISDKAGDCVMSRDDACEVEEVTVASVAAAAAAGDGGPRKNVTITAALKYNHTVARQNVTLGKGATPKVGRCWFNR